MYCKCGKFSENVRTGGPCATCKALERKETRLKADKAVRDLLREQKMKLKQKEPRDPIKKVSGKMAAKLSRYMAIRAEWLPGKMCAVEGNHIATEVHHMKGRVGYADQWAKDNDIPLLIDVRFWLPVSSYGHKKITDNSAWAEKMGYSLPRNVIF